MLGISPLSATPLDVAPVGTAGAVVGTLSGTCTVIVSGTNAVVSSVALLPTTLALLSGGATGTIAATAYNALGVPLSGKLFSAASSDETVVTVSISGSTITATSVGQGTANITATSEGVTSSACAVTVNPLNPPLYVSTTGTSGGAGTFASPWSLTYALSGANGASLAGVTIYLRGGTYVGQFSCALNGTAGNLITFQAYPGERVLIDGNVGPGSIAAPILTVSGNYTKWKGLEILNSDPLRVSTQVLSFPTDMNFRSSKTIRNQGQFNQFHNLLIHDTSNGIEDQNIGTAWASEWWGCWVWNVGWDAPDRGHGHSLYIQNASTTKSFKDIVSWGAHDINVQLDGTSDTSILNFLFDHCVSGSSGWHSGASSPTGNMVMANADPTKCGNSTFSNSDWFGLGGGIGNFGFQGTATGSQPMTFTGNRFAGVGPVFSENLGLTITGNKFSLGAAPVGGHKIIAVRRLSGQPYSDHTFNSNTYCGVASDLPFYDVLAGVGTTRNFAGWQAGGWDPASSFTEGNSFTGSDIVVHAVATDTGRGHVRCWNWDSASSLAVDLSSILSNGDKYVVHHLYDPFGAPVASGTYAGGTVSLPQTTGAGLPDVPNPFGLASWIPSMSPKYNVFRVLKATNTAVPAAPTIGTATATGASTIALTWTSNSAGAETGFLIEQQVTNGWRVDGVVGSGVLSYTSSNLIGLTNYVYRVRSYNDAGQSTVSATANATTGSASGTVFINETFSTDAAGTLIANHQGELGAVWQQHPTFPGTAQLTAGGALRASTASTNSLCYASGIPASADYDVEADLVVKTMETSSQAGICGRSLISGAFANTYYIARYNKDSTQWQLIRFDANGATSTLGTFTQTLVAGNTYHVMLRMRGTTISLLVGGVSRISVTDSDANLSGAGRADIWFQSGPGTCDDNHNFHIDNFTVTNA